MSNDKLFTLSPDLVTFDKKEKGVAVTTKDACQLSLKKEEMESLL